MQKVLKLNLYTIYENIIHFLSNFILRFFYFQDFKMLVDERECLLSSVILVVCLLWVCFKIDYWVFTLKAH